MNDWHEHISSIFRTESWYLSASLHVFERWRRAWDVFPSISCVMQLSVAVAKSRCVLTRRSCVPACLRACVVPCSAFWPRNNAVTSCQRLQRPVACWSQLGALPR
jgi:hypothetical protein